MTWAATVYPSGAGRPAVPCTPVAAMAIVQSSVLIDRLVAVIGEQALTWRDMQAARLLGSIPATADDREAVERLITRELMRLEIERFSVAAPIAAAVDDRLRLARDRHIGEGAWTDALASAGLTDARARDMIADDLRIDIYLDQRFTAAAQPTDLEVSQHAATMTDRVPSPAQLDQARRQLVATRRTALIDAWIASIRGRTPVQRTWER